MKREANREREREREAELAQSWHSYTVRTVRLKAARKASVGESDAGNSSQSGR